MIVLPILFLSITSIVCTAVRAAEFVSDLLGRPDDVGLGHSTRDLYPTALHSPFNAREEVFDEFVRRAADLEYDDFLYTRDVLDYLLASYYATRELDLDPAPDLDRRANTIQIVVRRLEENPEEMHNIEVTPGVTTWATVKDDITGQTNGELEFGEMHIRHRGKEPKDEDVVPVGTKNLTLVRFYMDEDIEHLPPSVVTNARPGAGPKAGGKGGAGKVKKGAKGKGKKVGKVGPKKAAAKKAKGGKK